MGNGTVGFASGGGLICILLHVRFPQATLMNQCFSLSLPYLSPRSSLRALPMGQNGTPCMGGCRTGTIWQQVFKSSNGLQSCSKTFLVYRLGFSFRNIFHLHFIFHYLPSLGCMELTLELNERKWPDLPRLAEMWDENLDAFITYPSIMVLGGEKQVQGQIIQVLDCLPSLN